MDENITLKDISKIINLCKQECKIIASNPDKLIPVKNGFNLECGVIIDLIENFSDKKVEILGKPSKYGYEYILSNFNKLPKNTLMIGDTYETDIIGALQMGINPAWISTGNTLPYNLETRKFMKFKDLSDVKIQLEKVKNSFM
jgi:HAD superfamily hydrolase (TIGR01450 family)